MLANNAMATELEVEQALEEIGEVLTSNGYVITDGNNSIVVSMGNPSNPLPVVITCIDQQLQITCQLTDLGVIGEEQLAEFGVKSLDLNTAIVPYAVALISDEGEAHTWPIVLIDTIPASDLQESEIISALESLNAALPLAAGLIGEFEAQAAVPA